MLPVTIGLGVINFDLVINSVLGTLVSDQAPRAIDRAFRLYMLPQGIFSVAIATVLFPTLSPAGRAARPPRACGARAATGVRQIALTLIPAAVVTAVLATPLTRLVYQRGEFGAESTELVVDGAVLVRVLAALRGREPAAHAHVLQPAAAVDPDRAWPCCRWWSTRRLAARSTSRSGSRAS